MLILYMCQKKKKRPQNLGFINLMMSIIILLYKNVIITIFQCSNNDERASYGSAKRPQFIKEKG